MTLGMLHTPTLKITLLFNINYGRYLRIPDSYDAKIARNWNLWTFWTVIQCLISKIWSFS